MTATYLSVVLDLYDAQGNLTSAGTATLTPSAALPDVPDQMYVTTSPVVAQFSAGGSPIVRLLATDSPGPQPPGWGWKIGFSAPGGPAAYSFFAPAGPASFTATNATPCVFTWTPTSALTSLPNGTAVQLSGGSVPAGFTAGTTYYVVASSGTTFQLAATSGGSPIASTSTGSGSLTVVQYRLSALSPVSSVTTMQGFMPLPSGTPSAGQAPIATGSGTGTAWGNVAVNPMTGPGDLVYGGASGAMTRLPGDTSNTRKFLREQSSGGAAQPPAWDTLQAGDIPALPYDAAGAATAAAAYFLRVFAV